MRRNHLLLVAALLLSGSAMAQTDVTNQYIQNADFGARYAGWINQGATAGVQGGFTHQTNASFSLKSGEIYLEKYVSAGSRVSNCDIHQVLRGLPAGTYTLTAAAKNTQGNNAEQTGAFLYAGQQQTEVSAEQDYSVKFTVLTGKETIGFKTQSATGNHVCIDNFRLTQEALDMDAIHASLQAMIDEAKNTLGEGNTASELQQAISEAEALLTQTTTEGVQAAAIALERATTNYLVSNGTGKLPTVTTNNFVVMGSTIALARADIKNNSTTLKESGYCWSTQPEPTVLDERTTEYFSNNGKIFRMDGLQPATFYYVRPYAWTTDNQVAYGQTIKIATKPLGTMTYSYDFAGDTEINARINSSIAETVWMYNNLTTISGVNLNVHYASGTPTADCSYGGWMRVGPSFSYQQTGTLLHETNHGVGVGTHWVWYNNASLRANTTYGKWLGPHANEMAQFITNDANAFMQGDGTHMWGGSSTSGSPGMINFGINGAHEDKYNPSDQLLYFSNILVTHALHVDGLPFNWDIGFASPAYVFEQEDGQKYYIKSEVDEYGTASFLGHNASGTLQNKQMTMEEALEDDNMAWYITFNPRTGFYTLQNVGSGQYIGVTDGKLKAQATAATIQLMPSREKTTFSKEKIHSFWITNNKGAYALRANTATGVGTAAYDNAANATAQRWFLLNNDQLSAYDNAKRTVLQRELNTLVKEVRKVYETPHEGKNESINLTEVDEKMEGIIVEIETAIKEGSYTTAAQVSNANTALQNGLVSFLSYVRPTEVAVPFELTFLLQNPGISSNEGWSTSFTYQNNVGEMYTANAFTISQTTSLKLPIGTYQLRAQAFQRAGSYADAYPKYKDGTEEIKASLFLKGKATKIKSIFDDAQPRTMGTGSVDVDNGVFIPNTMQSAYSYFRRGYYTNEVVAENTTQATLALGIRATAATESYWTCFDNFQLFYFGNLTSETVTGVESVEIEQPMQESPIYDLSGRRTTKPQHGIYIQNGKKYIK